MGFPRGVTPAPLLILVMSLAAAGCSTVRDSDSTPAEATAVSSNVEAQQQLVKKGKSQFLHCNSCHVVDATAPPPFGDSLGPHLEGIVGRTAASVEGFTYTEELEALELVWDEETLDDWLQQPQAMVPEMCMPFTGIANPESRRALIAYLKNPKK